MNVVVTVNLFVRHSDLQDLNVTHLKNNLYACYQDPQMTGTLSQ